MKAGCTDEPLALDFFSSGMPAGMVFEMSLDDLDHVLDLAAVTEVDRIAEVCFIGLVSYFEAFCKDHAASIINIAPSLIETLRKAGYETRVDAQRALEFGARYRSNIGCLVMESYDFGTAKRINAIFNTLLKIAPFSQRDVTRYDEILRDRNLIVHHGATYTSKYLEQIGAWRERMSDTYFHSLVVTPEMLKKTMMFFERIAKKLCQASHTALSAYVKTSQVSLGPERRKALDFLLWSSRPPPEFVPSST